MCVSPSGIFSASPHNGFYYLMQGLAEERLIGACQYASGMPAILIMATVNHFILSQLSKLARLEAEMSRNIDFYALLAPEMAGITFVAFDQQPK